MDYLYTADASEAAPDFRRALRILATPQPGHTLGPNPLGLSAERLASLAEWSARQREGK